MFLRANDQAGLDELLRSSNRRILPALVRLTAALRCASPQPDWTVQQMRDGFEEVACGMLVPEEVTVSLVTIDGLRAEVIEPHLMVARTTLYLHGGAYTIGSLDTVRALASRYAMATRSRTVVLDYRLAPEHPYPAAVDDASRAWAWVVEHFGGDDLVVAGDSAGGGLAIATALRVVADGDDAPHAVVAMSPWTDLTMDEAEEVPANGDPQAPLWMLRQSAGDYLAGQSGRTPLASPLFADLSVLPPTLVHVGSAEPLYGDGVRFTRAALDAGAPATLECWDGMIHVWHAFAPRLEQANAGLASIDGWLNRLDASRRIRYGDEGGP